jgi:hypothetical protein
MSAASPQSFNRYAYVGNNPMNRIDPSGLEWTSDASQQGCSSRYLSFIGSGWSMLNSKVADGWDSEAFASLDYIKEQEEASVTVTAVVNGALIDAMAEFWTAIDPSGLNPENPFAASPQEHGDPSSPVDGPFVFGAVARNPNLFLNPLGTTKCASWVQKVAAELGDETLGKVGASNWVGGQQVITAMDIRPGTVIASGIDPRTGKYRNASTGNHAGFFLGFIYDKAGNQVGFNMWENAAGNIGQHSVMNVLGSYYSSPDQYFVVMVPKGPQGGPGRGRPTP